MNNIIAQKLEILFSDFSKMKPEWRDFFANESRQEYWQKLQYDVAIKYQQSYVNHRRIFPAIDNIFKLFELCDIDNVKCCILGQDPYHGFGQAHGLSFSVQKDIFIPPSLKNIYKELKEDLNLEIPTHGCLESWVLQGVFLLNTILTVEEGMAGSHKNLGWQILTDHVISKLNEHNSPKIFVLWGNFARQKKSLITSTRHLILESAHPSPLSSHHGFFGSQPFSKINQFLLQNHLSEIDWRIECLFN